MEDFGLIVSVIDATLALVGLIVLFVLYVPAWLKGDTEKIKSALNILIPLDLVLILVNLIQADYLSAGLFTMCVLIWFSMYRRN